MKRSDLITLAQAVKQAIYLGQTQQIRWNIEDIVDAFISKHPINDSNSKMTGDYTLVNIKSKDDWPEKGEYFCCRSGFMVYMTLDRYLPENSFMREIRWYLKPIKTADSDVK